MTSLVLAIALMFLQTQTPPAATVEGIVVQMGTSTPVVRARVSVGLEQTLTDESGRFALQIGRPGRYRVVVSHNAYVPAQFGERVLGGTGREIDIAAGQTIKGIVVPLVPKSAISGRISDRNGDPVTNATVQAFKYVYQEGRRILVSVDSARSNDRGDYRLFWLTPGPYLISVSPQPNVCADSVCSMLIETKNAVSGPAPVVGGTVRLDGRVAVRVSDGGENYLPVYYPGTTDAAMASMIDVPPGVDFSGVDVRIVEALAVRVFGRVVNGVTGQAMSAATASISLVPRRGTIATGSSQRGNVALNGTFEFRHMAPGSYDLVATANAGGIRLAASLPLDISNKDIEDITLILQPQLSINGRVAIENFQSNGDLNLSGIRVELRREPYTPELLVVLPTVMPDGTFTFGGVTPGDYRLKVETRGLKGYIKSARFGAVDALNPPFRIDGPGQFDLVIGISSGTLQAVALDEKQNPFPDATVVLVPDPPRRERFDLYAAGAGASGRVLLSGLAPGDYKVFAWDDVQADAWQDPDFIRRYEDRGKPIHISEGSNEAIQLNVLKGR